MVFLKWYSLIFVIICCAYDIILMIASDTEEEKLHRVVSLSINLPILMYLLLV